MTVFTNVAGNSKQQVAFAAPYPGKILAVDLKQWGGRVIAQGPPQDVARSRKSATAPDLAKHVGRQG